MKSFTRNILWNCAGVAVDTVTGFFLAPFVIHRLGDSAYGLWIVLGSLTSYFGLLDLGVRGSVGRYIAFHRATQDQAAINQTLSTAAAILGTTGLLALSGVLATLPLFFHVFSVPAGLEREVAWALVLVACNLGLSLVLNIFDATLWGFQRFDVLNAIDIPVSLTRAGLTVFFLGQGCGLTALAWITLVMTGAGGLAKAVSCFRENPKLSVRPAHVRRQVARQIIGYGFWSLVGSLGGMGRGQIPPLMIGSILGVASITPYAVARRVVYQAGGLLAAITGVLTPHATALHAKDDRERQRTLFVHGGRYCWAMALYFLALLTLLGGPLIALWMGPTLLSAVPLLIVLALGESVPNSTFINTNMIFAAAKHRSLAYLSGIELGMIVVLIALLGPRYGLLGICWATAIPGLLCRGLAVTVRGCMLSGISPKAYGVEILAPVLGAATVPALGLGLAIAWRSPSTWAELVLYAAVYSVAHAASCLLVFASSAEKRLVAAAALRVVALARRPLKRLPQGTFDCER